MSLLCSLQPSDKTIFAYARKMVVATLQKITYEEYLPALFGRRFFDAKGPSYHSRLPPTVQNSFTSAARRCGSIWSIIRSHYEGVPQYTQIHAYDMPVVFAVVDYLCIPKFYITNVHDQTNFKSTSAYITKSHTVLEYQNAYLCKLDWNLGLSSLITHETVKLKSKSDRSSLSVSHQSKAVRYF